MVANGKATRTGVLAVGPGLAIGVLVALVCSARHDGARAESALSDCSIPFEQLQKKSESCTSGMVPPGRRCERYSVSQFGEIVSIRARSPLLTTMCTGTLIAKDWVLTAAHCFLGDNAAKDLQNGSRDNFILRLTKTDMSPSARVIAENVSMPSESERTRWGDRVIVPGSYAGAQSPNSSIPPFLDDLALVHLEEAFPDTMQPAIIAAAPFEPKSTIAGYGYSNADGGTLGKFNLTWPADLSLSREELSFKTVDADGHHSTFCQGDSGGPVFAGRYRGCAAADPGGEPRPRLLQGTISYIKQTGKPPEHANSAAHAEACRYAEVDVMQHLNIRRRRWICVATANAAGGC